MHEKVVINSFALAESHEHTAALETARKAVSAAPKNSRSYVALGHALYLSGDSRSAIPALKRAVKMDPHNRSAWELLCGAMVQNGRSDTDYADTLKVLSQATAAAPQSYLVPYYAGLLYTGRRQYDDAIAAFQLSLDLNPVNADALYNLSAAQAFAGRLDESSATRRKFTGMSEYSRAATDLQLRVQRDPARRDLWVRLLHLAEANSDAARAAYCRYRLNKDFPALANQSDR